MTTTPAGTALEVAMQVCLTPAQLAAMTTV
jgi:hypothetical protein